MTVIDVVVWTVLNGCLLFACVTDLCCGQVYNFTWWIGILVQTPLLWAQAAARLSPEWRTVFPELAVFCLLQLLLAGRIYGKADAYAFCTCALALVCLGKGVQGFLVHMLLAYVLLFLVQVARRNVAGNGNLKKPVPFLPYITLSFWGTIILCGLR